MYPAMKAGLLAGRIFLKENLVANKKTADKAGTAYIKSKPVYRKE